jgi:hypothetical protein
MSSALNCFPALRYFDLFDTKGARFQRRYLALLSNGYDAPPDKLLVRFIGIRLGDPALIDGAVRLLESWVRQLKSLYRSISIMRSVSVISSVENEEVISDRPCIQVTFS